MAIDGNLILGTLEDGSCVEASMGVGEFDDEVRTDRFDKVRVLSSGVSRVMM